MGEWTPTSWRDKPALQQPNYADAAGVEAVLAQLAKLPPLVTSWEIERLKQHLIASAAYMRLIMMGGLLLVVMRFAPRGLIPEK